MEKKKPRQKQGGGVPNPFLQTIQCGSSHRICLDGNVGPAASIRPASNHVQDTLRFERFPLEFQEVTGENFLHDVQCSREFLQ